MKAMLFYQVSKMICQQVTSPSWHVTTRSGECIRPPRALGRFEIQSLVRL